MSSTRGRNRSVSLAFANLSRPVTHRRSQSSLIGLNTRSVRVVVLGVGGVGKTAMIVRFITKRFIGDYDPTLETIYRHTTTIDDQLVHFEIMDTAGQEDNSLMLEDKCKWGESFIFVYDVTDKYSFDELTRLKFIASYTHSRMRVNFKPCWILVGNKTDLAEHDRMVSTEEGMALARDLGCHVFREISVKESINDASDIFEDLWREFSRLSPRSPSTSQRRKFSCRIQDKISVLDSEACACASEAHKTMNNNTNGSIVSSLASALKRQTSVPSIYTAISRKDAFYNDSNNNEERQIPKIAEHKEDSDNTKTPTRTPNFRRRYARRNGVTANPLETKSSSFPALSKPECLCDVTGDDNPSPDPSGEPLIFLASSSRSSSVSSLNGSISPSDSRIKMKQLDPPEPVLPLNSDSPNSDNLVTIYRDHCMRTRGRPCDSSKLSQSLNTFSPSSSKAVSGY